jgi:hypothetical protein
MSAEQLDGPVVVNLGYGRTGTNSIQDAMDILGLSPCYHTRVLIPVPRFILEADRVCVYVCVTPFMINRCST